MKIRFTNVSVLSNDCMLESSTPFYSSMKYYWMSLWVALSLFSILCLISPSLLLLKSPPQSNAHIPDLLSRTNRCLKRTNANLTASRLLTDTTFSKI